MNILTHELIDRELCGNPVSVTDGSSRIEYITTQRMAADTSGLVHGGFQKAFFLHVTGKDKKSMISV